MKSKSVILVGGEGYIGGVIRNYLLKKKFQVYSIDKIIYNQKKDIIKNKNYKFYNLNICKKNTFKSLEKIHSENLVILGSIVGDPITKKYPKITKKVNLIATESLLKFALKKKQYKKIIFISTCSNYGIFKKNFSASEDSILNPKSLYAKTKVSIEKKLEKLSKKYNSEITILRFATAFGLSPRMRFDLTVNQFVREIYLKKKIEIFDPYTWRPYCHVTDFAKIINQILSNKSVKRKKFEIFNAGSSSNNFNKIMIIKKIKKFIKNFQIIIKQNSADPRDYKVNFSKIKKVYGFRPSVSVDRGIKEIILELKKGNFKNISNYKDKLGNYKILKNV